MNTTTAKRTLVVRSSSAFTTTALNGLGITSRFCGTLRGVGELIRLAETTDVKINYYRDFDTQLWEVRLNYPDGSQATLAPGDWVVAVPITTDIPEAQLA